jgi:hypothetical protein
MVDFQQHAYNVQNPIVKTVMVTILLVLYVMMVIILASVLAIYVNHTVNFVKVTQNVANVKQDIIFN